MATSGPAAEPTIRPIDDRASDYGSDFDESDFAAVDSTVSHPRLESINNIDPLPHVLHITKREPSVDLSRRQRPRLDDESNLSHLDDFNARDPVISIEYIEDCDQRRLALANPHKAERSGVDHVLKPDDKLSPLERFRTAPRKPLSVTDLSSPAWCELKYWYSLTKYGRVRRTPAMRQGSRVHKKLEEQVHETVPVEITTREDAFALRIFNVIQGLRTLKNTGLTREFQVWGVIDGQVVNGVIDELTTTAPDKALKGGHEKADENQTQNPMSLPSDQSSLQQFLKGGDSTADAPPVPRTALDQVYLADVKTRQNKHVPYGRSLRPVHMQLQIYYKLLSSLAAGNVDKAMIFRRFGLDADASFSDAFIAQIGGLDLAGETDDVDLVNEVLEFNTLSKMWDHMIDEFSATMPVTEKHSSISTVFRVEFRSAGTGDVMDSVLLSYMEQPFNDYLATEMAWWRGERPAVGVAIEDAQKCHSCEFAEVCTWRQEKAEEFRAKTRQRQDLAVKQNGRLHVKTIEMMAEGEKAQDAMAAEAPHNEVPVRKTA